MDSGAYRELVKIQKYVEGMDEIGNPSDRWKDYKRTYAYVNGLSGVEYWEVANEQVGAGDRPDVCLDV